VAATDLPRWLGRDVWPFDVEHLGTDVGSIAYTDAGTGPVLLFVHTGLWSFVWRDLMAELVRRYRCVALDAPGTGLTRGSPSVDLRTAAKALDAVVRELDLWEITIVMHDLGGPAALEAAAGWPERIAGLVAVNTFAWRPHSPMFRGMLATMGSMPMRELDALTGFLPRMTSSRFGVGRHYDHKAKRAFRRGISSTGRRSFHRYMRSARRHDYTRIEATVATLADMPVLTIFGQRNDPLKFQPQWQDRFGLVEQHQIKKGYHFPMCDNPTLVANTIDDWHTRKRTGSPRQ
jgi:haloalkane dehalogenase